VLANTLLYAASLVVAAWGLAHLIPTRSVVNGLGTILVAVARWSRAGSDRPSRRRVTDGRAGGPPAARGLARPGRRLLAAFRPTGAAMPPARASPPPP